MSRPKTMHFYTPAEVQMLRDCFHTHTPDELAERIGVTRDALQVKANKLGLLKRSKSKEIREHLMGLAVEGFYSIDVVGWPIKLVRNQADKLRDAGKLFAASIPTKVGRTCCYFDTPEKAEAFRPKETPPGKAREPKKIPKAYKARNMRDITIAKPKGRAGWGPTDPVRITSQTIVTIAPTPARALWTNTFSRW